MTDLVRSWFRPNAARSTTPNPNVGLWSWATSLMQPQERLGTGVADIALGQGPGVADTPVLGRLSTNPIGAGVVVAHPTQASYGPAAVYEAGTIFWRTQNIPTSFQLTGLLTPAQLAQLLHGNVTAAYRVG